MKICHEIHRTYPGVGTACFAEVGEAVPRIRTNCDARAAWEVVDGTAVLDMCYEVAVEGLEEHHI
jgi:hypothetical protein